MTQDHLFDFGSAKVTEARLALCDRALSPLNASAMKQQGTYCRTFSCHKPKSEDFLSALARAALFLVLAP